jgi:hypothetical protein
MPRPRTKPRHPGKQLVAMLAKQGIQNPSPDDVVKYLDGHRKLAAIVPAVCERARQEFGKQAELILRLYRDPEIDDRYLSLYVRLPVYNDSTMDRMDRVLQAFDEQLCKATGYLLLTTDFRSPRGKNGV